MFSLFGIETDEYEPYDLDLLHSDAELSGPAPSASPAPAPATDSGEPELDADADSPSSSDLLFGPLSSHSRKKKPGHIPRPPNAFMLFRSELWRKEKVKRTVERDHRNISRIAGRLWNDLDPADRVPYLILADEAKRRHSKLYPGYKYAPVPRRDHSGKRKAKPDHSQKVRRCEKVVRLVQRGFVGDALEKELCKRKVDPDDGCGSDASEYVEVPRRKRARKVSKASTKKTSASKASASKRAHRPQAIKVAPREEEHATCPAEVNDDGASGSPTAQDTPRASSCPEEAPVSPDADTAGFVPTSDIPEFSLGEPAYNSCGVRFLRLI